MTVRVRVKASCSHFEAPHGLVLPSLSNYRECRAFYLLITSASSDPHPGAPLLPWRAANSDGRLPHLQLMSSLNALTSYQSTPAQSPAPSAPNAINLDLNLFEPKIEDFDSASLHTPPPHTLFFDNKSRRDSEFEMLDALVVAAPVVGNKLHTPESAAKLQVQHELAVLGPILDLERGGSTGSEELFSRHPYDRGSSPLSMQSDSDRDGGLTTPADVALQELKSLPL